MRVRVMAVAFLAAMVGAALPASVLAQTRPRHKQQHAGPWNQDLVMATSTDGLRFDRGKTVVEGAGVASLVAAKDGALLAVFQWFPQDEPEAFDKVALIRSADNGKSWSEPVPIEVEGLPESFQRPFDPTLVQLDDGRFRLYFSCGEAPKRGSRGDGPATFSAISTDALHFTFEPGVRFQVDHEWVIDCAVAKLGTTWHYFAPIQNQRGKAYHAVSDDGLKFTRSADLSIQARGSWLGCGLVVDGKLRFYGTGLSAVSADGDSWTIEENYRAVGADPGVVKTAAGEFIMIATGPRVRNVSDPRGFIGDEGDAKRGPEGSPTQPRHPDEGSGGEDGEMGPEGFPMGPEGAIAANDRFVYVLFGGDLLQFEARSLRFIRRVRLDELGEPEAPPEGMGPDGRRRGPRPGADRDRQGEGDGGRRWPPRGGQRDPQGEGEDGGYDGQPRFMPR